MRTTLKRLWIVGLSLGLAVAFTLPAAANVLEQAESNSVQVCTLSAADLEALDIVIVDARP